MEKYRSLKGGFKRQFIYIYIYKKKLKQKWVKREGWMVMLHIFNSNVCLSIIRKSLQNTKLKLELFSSSNNNLIT